MAIGCRTCGTLSPDRARTCEYCGASFPATPVYRDPFVRRRGAAAQGGLALATGPYLRPAPAPPKDPSTGLLIELLPGLFGFLGIGHLWAGETALGLALLLGYWAFWSIVAIATVLTLGLLLCFLPLLIIFFFAAPLISALALQRRLRARQALAIGSTAQYAIYPY